MKRLLLILLCFLLIAGISIGDSPATPTDIEEYTIFEDDDFGYIDPSLIERKVFLQFLKEPTYYGDEVTLIAILVDFRENDIYRFEWEESEDGEEWWRIIGADEQTYSFIVDHENVTHYWRVLVILEEYE